MSHHEHTEKAHHAHPNYFKIYITLLVLLVISVLGPMLEIKAVTLITAFGIAIVKATMVASYFMHLNVEKKYIWWLLLICVALMFMFFFTLAPDVMEHAGRNWRKI